MVTKIKKIIIILVKTKKIIKIKIIITMTIYKGVITKAPYNISYS